MNKESFETFIKVHGQEIEDIRQAAWNLHESVGQTYDKTLPYGYHLSMVADTAILYGYEVSEKESDILPVIFAAYYHDSIEDARLTYNDVTEIASHYMSKDQTIIAAEIVYALTNDKGRTRNERAGEHYYQGIRETPYAPFVKLCDRYANMSHCFSGDNMSNLHMQTVYQNDWLHFISAIDPHSNDVRMTLPQQIIAKIEALFN